MYNSIISKLIVISVFIGLAMPCSAKDYASFDLQKVIVASKAGKAAKEELEQLVNKFRTEQLLMEDMLKKMKSELEPANTSLGEKERAQKEAIYKERLKEYGKLIGDVNDDLKKWENQIVSFLINEVVTAIKESKFASRYRGICVSDSSNDFCKGEGLVAGRVEGTLSMADADDITLDVQELIDRKEIVAASIKIIGLNAPSNIVRALMEPNRQLDFGMNDPTGYFSGIVAYEQGNYDLAKKNLKPFAEKGHSKAQFMMAIIGYEETGVAKDQAEAVRWYRKLAENGDEFAQTRLVKAYEKGNGVNQDQAEAVRWYRKLAEKGVVRAQFKLGLIYYNGSDPIKASHAEAFHWFSEAAKKNNGKAQHWVANMLHLGEGVPPNTELALQWIDKAIKNGAGKDAEELKEHMGWCKDHESESRFKKKKKKEVKKPEGE